ncbi:MAG TPA: cephalosporin hydroxylase family protein [Denitromonas sp.]|uniref:cephalosporin hydroxylase family protein n=1 Tax=Denitromonas sp. TaxID=2734609 RepID=UPI001DE23A7B|nr:cephalosporin hydroxylase family protein [Rhodocyclaceae bacterium]MCP5223086.1 cephalosporin hydroxylase family protein [Zoogloeaceae bacterium]HQU87930.1 cephalosporin hydroxylase family protein [Denitromonas sp.]HQV14913.1 cephalosporin hydroxylase family protein [Denitromonas sp.]
MDDHQQFAADCAKEIQAQADDAEFRQLSRAWMDRAQQLRYSYHFEWMGRPIIQYPTDILAMQELMWRIQPDLVIETGIARGGSLIFYASMMQMLGRGEVLGIDIDIRAHNREAIESHPMASRIRMIEGSSLDAAIVAQAAAAAEGKKVMVVLDSNHTHEHVLGELERYAPLTSPGSYCVVMDTVVEDMPASLFGDRPWAPGDNPKTAVHAWLKTHPEFEIDNAMDAKLAVSVAPHGYLRRRA